MPQANLFRHQAYTNTLPISPRFRLKPGSCPAVGSDEFRRRMRQIGAALRAQRVAAVYLAHGTLVGPEAPGILADLARLFPSARQAMRRLIARTSDQWMSDVGNYTESYAYHFETGINEPGEDHIPVRLFHWSGENHHLGRADGAVRLIDELASLDLMPGQRVLLWGHSHAGNVFAIASNLLSGNREALERFFQAAEVYYRWPVLGWVDIPLWERVRCLLGNPHAAVFHLPLDMVTFGTPVRYGWDSAGYSRLLHFIHRRPGRGISDYRASFPLSLEQVLSAAEGDYVQQLGIAGTNVAPGIVSWRARLADHRLQRLLQSDLAGGSPLERFRTGTIVPDEGTTLLVDYGDPQQGIAQHHAGHAVYTRKQWLLFHADEVTRRFYQAEAARQVA